MKKYIKPEIEVNGIQPEGFLATSFEGDGEIDGPVGAPPIESYTSDDFWSFDYSR